MTRYVDADALIETLKKQKDCRGALFIPFLTLVKIQSTADVVPKSEVMRIFEEIDSVFRKHYETCSQTDLKLLEPIRQCERFIINEMWHEIAELKKKYIGDKQRKEDESNG